MLKTTIDGWYSRLKELNTEINQLIGRRFVIPRGPYRGRVAVISYITLWYREIAVHVDIEKVDCAGFLNNDHARSWQSWRLRDIADLL